LGDLAAVLLADSFASLSENYRPEEAGRWTVPEVSGVLRTRLARICSVSSDRVTPDADIFRDLVS
jgi:hypothetical protein